MKKLLKFSKSAFLGISICATLCSCSDEQSKMKSEIKAYLEKNAKDPKSYEFVDLKILDTVTVGDMNKDLIESMNDSIKKIQSEIEFNEKMIKDYPTLSHDKEIEENRLFNILITDINSRLTKANQDFKNPEIVGYIVTHKYRLKNGFGALDLSEDWVYFDKNIKLLSFGEFKSFTIFDRKP